MKKKNKKLPVPRAWSFPIRQWLQIQEVKGLSQQSITLYASHLSQLAREVGGSPTEVTASDLLEWCASKPWAVETRRSIYSTYKQFFEYIHPNDPEHDPTSVLKKPRASCREPRPIPDQVLLSALNQTTPRIRLMILLGSLLGLRIGEIARLRFSDIEDEVSGPVLRVTGKGNKRRSIPLTEPFAKELREWCRSKGGWAFPSQRGGHLNAHSASSLVNKALPRPWTSHTLRHRFATRAYSAERDILTLQRLLGHSSVATTMRYAKPPDDAIRTAMHEASVGITEVTDSLRKTTVDLRDKGRWAVYRDPLRLEFSDGEGSLTVLLLDPSLRKQLAIAISEGTED